MRYLRVDYLNTASQDQPRRPPGRAGGIGAVGLGRRPEAQGPCAAARGRGGDVRWLSEAGHRSIFVAGWRSFIGWVCGFALAWLFILFDLLTWITVNFFPHVTAIPLLTGAETLVTVLMSLLGLGAMRTAEKFGGRTR